MGGLSCCCGTDGSCCGNVTIPSGWFGNGCCITKTTIINPAGAPSSPLLSGDVLSCSDKIRSFTTEIEGTFKAYTKAVGTGPCEDATESLCRTQHHYFKRESFWRLKTVERVLSQKDYLSRVVWTCPGESSVCAWLLVSTRTIRVFHRIKKFQYQRWLIESTGSSCCKLVNTDTIQNNDNCDPEDINTYTDIDFCRSKIFLSEPSGTITLNRGDKIDVSCVKTLDFCNALCLSDDATDICTSSFSGNHDSPLYPPNVATSTGTAPCIRRTADDGYGTCYIFDSTFTKSFCIFLSDPVTGVNTNLIGPTQPELKTFEEAPECYTLCTRIESGATGYVANNYISRTTCEDLTFAESLSSYIERCITVNPGPWDVVL